VLGTSTPPLRTWQPTSLTVGSDSATSTRLAVNSGCSTSSAHSTWTYAASSGTSAIAAFQLSTMGNVAGMRCRMTGTSPCAAAVVMRSAVASVLALSRTTCTSGR
jgi:hypothetical protein